MTAALGPDGLAVWEADGVLFPVAHNLSKQAPGLGRKGRPHRPTITSDRS